MAKRMLVDATHPEETRVVVVSGNRLEELDFEIASRKQLKGNIYLAKVIRVEPSLQAAFVEYGGNRHGFLAFSEIHPDYYRIPVADREALLREQEREYEAGDREPASVEQVEDAAAGIEETSAGAVPVDEIGGAAPSLMDEGTPDGSSAEDGPEGESPLSAGDPEDGSDFAGEGAEDAGPDGRATELRHSNGREGRRERRAAAAADGGETVEEDTEEERRRRPRPLKSYKIQEVIKRRQILLVQVTKEERGNKGAALTTYLSLPGRYCVLMPNTPRGGGISRKITNPADRKRMKELLEGLDVPQGMSVILRTAGIERSKPEIKRDLEYLMRLWDSIRELTLQSVAPALIYEEANLIKRSIRDLYASDIDEVIVEGEQGYRTAKDFMRMLMPSHAKKVQPYKDDIPLFHRFQVEGAIETMFDPVVQLRSGGYIVINQTEALVAIDVNSGRSTKERNIEETALRTNLEAAEEIARQLRLRDLAGLIVIDFIDMEEARNNASVEKRLKEAMKADRARIQLGRISPFGLLELSRQRLRPSLQEINFERCPHCAGTGLVRSVESAALAVLRAIEEEGIRRRSAEITVTAAASLVLYILNQKRESLTAIERRYGLRVYLAADDSLTPPAHRLERLRARQPGDDLPVAQTTVSAEKVYAETDRALEVEEAEEAEELEEETEESAATAPQTAEERSQGDRDSRRRRRRRRRRPGEARFGDAEATTLPADAETAERTEDAGAEGDEDEDADDDAGEEAGAEGSVSATGDDAQSLRKKRRRGKRGGRRRARQRIDGLPEIPGETLAEGEEAEGDDTEDGGAEDGGAGEAAEPSGALAVAGEGPALTGTETTVSEPVEPSPDAGVPGEAVTTGTVVAAAEPATAGTEPTAKPKRSRAPRKKAAETPAAAAEATPVAEAAPAEAAEAEEKPKAKRTRAPRKKTAETPAAAAEATPVAEAAPAEAAAAEEKPKAKRTRAPRKKTAAAETPAADTVTEAVTAVDTDMATAVTPAVETPAETSAAPAPVEAAPQAVVNPPIEAPKKGWWRR
ncbi:ribonuclease E/G [Rhodospirillum centenum]|uniref:Ribonuclease E n=1 Tax=Rhodospirillum centenum (strain ATCC 51521 / SW) TaxID=414684 RepID=B6INB6_RHOCS|nr:ribonuclease E/G [Rhodospirillum centenum]ACI99013.1 ribonuclease, Rne [Rhodospirillum centenum SW]